MIAFPEVWGVIVGAHDIIASSYTPNVHGFFLGVWVGVLS
jgi:hypothetical protein